MMKSLAGLESVGTPNSVWFWYDAVPAVATTIGSEYVRVVASSAVTRKIAVPAARACMTPSASILAMEGVSEVQVNPDVMVAPVVPDRNVAKSWSSKPTGSGTSPSSRPETVIAFAGAGGAGPTPLLQPPIVAAP